MKTFPIMMVVRDRLAVVVGGGAVGMRKVRSLLAAGARVRLVTARPPDPPTAEAVELICEPYRREHLAGAQLVFACTDDRALNARIAADARAAGGIVNAVDQPEDCDFYVPAVVQDGEVVIAIGTGGASPALSALLKRRLREALGEGAGALAEALAEVRTRLLAEVPDTRRRGRILKRLVTEDLLEAFRRRGPSAVEEALAPLIATGEEGCDAV